MAFELPPLPYDYSALEPYISANTLHFHHDKHHKGYVDKLNELVAGTQFASMPLQDIIRATARQKQHQAIFNNAAQVWNHTLQWNCLKQNGGGSPPGEIERKIKESFGDFARFKEAFSEAAVGRFGSGYAWLVSDNGKLRVLSTANAEVPFVDGKDVLFTCDVWEHAYYLDYQNRRAAYIEAVLDHLVNWEFVQQRMQQPAAALAGLA